MSSEKAGSSPGSTPPLMGMTCPLKAATGSTGMGRTAGHGIAIGVPGNGTMVIEVVAGEILGSIGAPRIGAGTTRGLRDPRSRTTGARNPPSPEPEVA